MARSEVFFQNRASNVPGAAEFVDIREVLKATGSLLGADQVGFSEIEDGKVFFFGDDLIFPSGGKFQPGNGC